jgi:phospholipid/cholesterol/gamma-HCH transport system substrate-binding protein
MEYSRTEVRTGLMIVAAALLAAVLIFVVGDFRNLFRATIRLTIVFDSSHGIKRFAEVRYAGVKVGEVGDIGFAEASPHRVVLKVKVRRDANIQEGSEARIKTLGFLGERYVDIEPPEVERPPVENGARITGRSSAQLEDLGIILTDLGDEIGQARARLDEILGDEQFRDDIKETVRRASELTEELKGMLSENRPAIRDALSSARSATSEVDELLRKHRDDLSSTFEHLASIADKLDGMADDLDALAEKSRGLIDRNQESIDRTVDDLRVTASNMRELSSDLKRNPHRLIKIFPSIFKLPGRKKGEKGAEREGSTAPGHP